MFDFECNLLLSQGACSVLAIFSKVFHLRSFFILNKFKHFWSGRKVLISWSEAKHFPILMKYLRVVHRQVSYRAFCEMPP